MKQIVYVTSALLLVNTLSAEERCPINKTWLDVEELDSMPLKKRGGGLDEKTKKILAQFANIVLGFFGILQDPNNVANVSAQVTEMVQHAVNIVTESVKKGELPLDATEEELMMFAQTVKKRLQLIS